MFICQAILEIGRSLYHLRHLSHRVTEDDVVYSLKVQYMTRVFLITPH